MLPETCPKCGALYTLRRTTEDYGTPKAKVYVWCTVCGFHAP